MQKINLTHRGPQVIECIDLFDEARYGADKLFFRKRCMGEGKSIFDEVVEQVECALNPSHFPQGGNPLTNMDEVGIEKCPIIALNRYHIPNKKFWNNTPPIGIANPYKASAAVRFSLRVHFRDDYAYIDFGCPWSEIMVDESTQTESSYVITKEDITTKFRLLTCHFISSDDAIQILKSIFGQEFNSQPTITTVEEVLEFVDDDGTSFQV